MDPQQIVAWAAPVAASLATFAGQRALTMRFERADEKREMARLETSEKRAAEAEWREAMERRMDEFERMLEAMTEKIDATLRGQLTDMRTDLVHKAHRYLDDLRCASTDEKNAFDEQYKTYAKLCEENDVKNDFINTLHDQVMALPGRM